MALNFTALGDSQVKESFVQWLIDEQFPQAQQHFGKLWDYYMNPALPLGCPAPADLSCRGYLQAQEIGLPPRITGRVYGAYRTLGNGLPLAEIQRKEVVIENDIAWRIHAMADFLFGKGIILTSKAPRDDRRRQIEQILNAVLTSCGGHDFLQELAALGSVYGFVDCLIRPGRLLTSHLLCPPDAHTLPCPSPSTPFDRVLHLASTLDLELIEAPRALPVLDENDYRKTRCYVQHFHLARNRIAVDSPVRTQTGQRQNSTTQRDIDAITEVISPAAWQRYENLQLVDQQPNPLGFVPVVHIQNIALPGMYEGLSDVEQLIPLQDELNTRLSDRASRLTMQSFKMYLVKGIDGAENFPIAPGRMWHTDNTQATIEQFGGDEEAPSESLHIAEIREAMDKISGVTPVVAGVLKNKVGNLTSGVALQMTLMGMLTRTSRKQQTYGHGIRRIGRMILDILDKAGVFPTDPGERDIEIQFPNPLPESS